MFKFLEIKYYTVFVLHTFALESITGAKKKKKKVWCPLRTPTLLKYFEMKCSA